MTAEVYDKAPAENCFIPTFASTHEGLCFPATVLKGAMRLAMLVERASDAQVDAAVANLNGETPRRSAALLEAAVLGAAGVSRTRPVRISDSRPVANGATRVYLLRTAVLIQRGEKFEAAWKGATRGSVPLNRAGEAAMALAEMAAPGTVFEGDFRMPVLFRRQETSRVLHWKRPAGPADIASAANRAATHLLGAHKKFAEAAGIAQIGVLCDALLKRVEEAQAAGRFLVCVGWGTGLLAKSIWASVADEKLREGLRFVPGYEQALRTGLPFPKTRKLIIRNGRPVSMPGWVEVELR